MAESSFYLESDLVTQAIPSIKNALRIRSKNLVLLTEVSVGTSIADLVFVSNLPNDPLPALSAFESAVLAIVRSRKKLSLHELVDLAGLEDGELFSSSLQRLWDYGLLVSSDSGNTLRVGRHFALRPRVYAIEAKLTRWKDALIQAVVYQSYANFSYILVPEEISSIIASNLLEFENAGVGVLISDGQRVRRMIPAKESDNYDWHREFFITRVPSDYL